MTEEIRAKLEVLTMKADDYEFFGETTYVVKTRENSFSVCDNGEEVANLDIKNAICVIVENLNG